MKWITQVRLSMVNLNPHYMVSARKVTPPELAKDLILLFEALRFRKWGVLRQHRKQK
jgi:hypothetical protein